MLHDVTAAAKYAVALGGREECLESLELVVKSMRAEISAINDDVDAAGAKLRLVWRLQRDRLLLQEVGA